MENKSLRLLLSLISAGLIVQGLVACKETDGQKPGAVATPATDDLGTTSGGGGNGLDGKLYEDYIRQPKELPAFQSLAGIFANIEAEQRKLDRPDDQRKSKLEFSDLFRAKTWYFVPTELKSISKDVLGVSFTKEKTQQIAFQKEGEVWVNSKIYDQMQTSEQATLLMHEFVMTLYFMKFQPLSEICKMSKKIDPTNEDGCQMENTSSIEVDKWLPAEELRPLKEEDYAQIRFFTSWILQNGRTADLKTIYTQMIQHGFDRRLFNPKNLNVGGKPDPKEEFKTKKGDLTAAMMRAHHAGRLPTRCVDAGGKTLGGCKIQVRASEVEYPGYAIKLPGFEVTLSDAAGNVLATAFMQDGYDATLSSTFDHQSETSYYMQFGMGKMVSVFDAKPGQRTTNLIVFLQKVGSGESARLEVVGVGFKHVVIVEVNPEAVDHNVLCRTENVQPKAVTDQTIFATTPEIELGVMHRYMFTNFSGISGCVKVTPAQK